jgi:probable DNA metabolism protein
MLTVRFDGSFQEWRLRARALLQHRVAPHEVNWASDAESTGLFDDPSPAPSTEDGPRIRIPRQLLDELEMAARYRTEQRWGLLYRVLWRVNQGDSSARMVGDIDGSELHGRIKAVRREAHHLHAFLRFSPLQTSDGPQHVAWFEPAHDVLPWAAGHFAERMGGNRWLIATPEEAVCWDGQQMYYTRPCPPQWRQLAQNAADPGRRAMEGILRKHVQPGPAESRRTGEQSAGAFLEESARRHVDPAVDEPRAGRCAA